MILSNQSVTLKFQLIQSFKNSVTELSIIITSSIMKETLHSLFFHASRLIVIDIFKTRHHTNKKCVNTNFQRKFRSLYFVRKLSVRVILSRLMYMLRVRAFSFLRAVQLGLWHELLDFFLANKVRSLWAGR